MNISKNYYTMARTAPTFIASGRLQDSQGVIHVLLSRLEDMNDSVNGFLSVITGFSVASRVQAPTANQTGTELPRSFGSIEHRETAIRRSLVMRYIGRKAHQRHHLDDRA